MAEQLFALKRDLDMVTQDVQILKNSYDSIDYIAGKFKDLWDEQTCQSAQMDRMAEDIKKITIRLNEVDGRLDRIEGDIKGLKSDMAELKSDMKFIKARLSK